MARKLAYIETATPRQDRQAMWECIRRLLQFSARDIRSELCGVPHLDTIRTYLTGLHNAGYLARIGERPLRYRLVRDCGVDAPRVRKDGRAVVQGAGREQMWRAMSIMRDFSAQDLAINASTEEHFVEVEAAMEYCGWLHRAGYLQRLQAHDGPFRYRLIPRRYSGPRPPKIQRIQQVYDPNTGQVVWSRKGGVQQ